MTDEQGPTLSEAVESAKYLLPRAEALWGNRDVDNFFNALRAGACWKTDLMSPRFMGATACCLGQGGNLQGSVLAWGTRKHETDRVGRSFAHLATGAYHRNSFNLVLPAWLLNLQT